MPRRKITKPKDLDDLKALSDTLPDLTDQQRRFVEGILAGKTASDAYRAAYDCSNALPNTIWCAASKLASDARVKQWLSAARQACLGTAVITKDGHLQQLERLREVALDSGNIGAAVQAEQYRGKVGGLYIDRFEDVTPTDPVETLKSIASLIGPQAARVLALKLGVSLIELHGHGRTEVEGERRRSGVCIDGETGDPVDLAISAAHEPAQN